MTNVVIPRKLIETSIEDLKDLLEEVKESRPGSYRASGTIYDLEKALMESTLSKTPEDRGLINRLTDYAAGEMSAIGAYATSGSLASDLSTLLRKIAHL